jgi:mannose-6-phosphate isomerase
MDRRATIAEAIRAPLPLAYHPLYRFYEGGRLSRAFRSLPDDPDDWWSEDWVGSCTLANNPDPDGRPQGLSTVDVPGLGPVTLREIIETAPEALVGAAFADRWGPIAGILVKLLSPAGQVPLHAHPSREWARRHLASPFGKTEAWILLETPGDGVEPAYAGIGFRPGIDRRAFADTVARHDRAAIRDTLHRTEVRPGEVYVAHAGVPHYLGPRVSFIEIQEPSDHIVIPETDGSDDDGATMGLGWELALDMIDYGASDREATLARARQEPRVLRRSGSSRETRLFQDDVRPFFEATRLDVEDEVGVEDGRFSIDIVTSGEGTIVGEAGARPIRRGDTFACAASFGHRFRAGREPLAIVRCLGPAVG